MVDQPIAPGLVIQGRLRIQRPLGFGFSGEVWLAESIENGKPVVVKFFPKGDSVHDEYYRHLVRLHDTLSSISQSDIISPIEIGQFDGLGYQVLPYVSDYKNLSIALETNPLVDPRYAMLLIAKIAAALGKLHAMGLVHADLKPSNILVSDEQDPQVRLIDFGMVRRIPGDDVVELVSTWRYLHPVFTGGARREKLDEKLSKRMSFRRVVGQDPDKSDEGTKTSIEDTRTKVHRRRGVTDDGDFQFERGGPVSGLQPAEAYIDIYALGILALEVIAGDVEYGRPVTEPLLQEFMVARNPLFSAQPDDVRDSISNLLFQMLTVHPGRSAISASTIAALARSSVTAMTHEPGAISTTAGRDKEYIQLRKPAPESVTAVVAFQRIRSKLEQQTVALLAPKNADVALASHDADAGVSDQAAVAFSSAKERIRSTWVFSVTMTLVAFGLTTLLIVAALGMAIFSDNYGRTAIFGGLGMTSLIGTLIWAPYDRLFSATLLTHEIEIAHIKFSQGLKSENRGEQLKACDEASKALRNIYREYGLAGKKTKSQRAPRQKQPPKAPDDSSIPDQEDAATPEQES